MKFNKAIKESIGACGATSTGDVQGLQPVFTGSKKKKKKVVRRPIKNKVQKI